MKLKITEENGKFGVITEDGSIIVSPSWTTPCGAIGAIRNTNLAFGSEMVWAVYDLLSNMENDHCNNLAKPDPKIESPFIDNRIVLHKTFATRLYKFVKDINFNDPMNEEEKTSILSSTEKLLRYQCFTATDASEISYLKRCGIYDEMTKPLLVTEDGVELFKDENNLVYSCMRSPSIGEQILAFAVKNLDSIERRNPDRILFKHKKNCENYIDLNTRKFTKADLEKAGVLNIVMLTQNG